MPRHFSANTTDLTQKVSRQLTSKSHKSHPAYRRDSDDVRGAGKKAFKIKDKYKSWVNEVFIDDEDEIKPHA